MAAESGGRSWVRLPRCSIGSIRLLHSPTVIMAKAEPRQAVGGSKVLQVVEELIEILLNFGEMH